MSKKAAILVKGINQLFSIPDVCLRVTQMAQSDKHSALDIAHEIGKDPHLAAQVLRLANSSFYAFPSRIDTLTRAVMVIGTQDLANMVLSMGFVNASRNQKPVHINLDDFWRHSLYTGILARRLGSLTSVRVLHRERLFVAGLLHDIGQLVMDYKIPELMGVMMVRAAKYVEPFYVSQQLIFDTDYADVGSELLKEWKLPVSLQENLRYQNSPENAGAQTVEAAVVHVANHYSSTVGLPSLGMENEHNLNPFVWKITGLTETLVANAMQEATQEYGLYLPYFIQTSSTTKTARRA